MTSRKAMSEKVLVLGVDGLDPRFAKRMMDQGRMPNLKKYYENGSHREDMMLLGANPPVTPPQWTTLACGCAPAVHSITQFYRHNPDDYGIVTYNLNSSLCKAEPIWNVTAEAGKKTCVFHWPGSAWPPTSDSPNLYVVDGSAPGAVGMAMLQTDTEFFVGANEAIETLRRFPAAASNATAVCVVDDLEYDENAEAFDMGARTSGGGNNAILMNGKDGQGVETGGPAFTYDAIQSYIKPAEGWADAPADAKEFALMTNKGLTKRYGLILKNEEGKYDHIAIYKSKKEVTPLCTCYVDQITSGVVDVTYKNDVERQAARNYLLLELAEDGSKLRMYASTAYATDIDVCFHPKYLHQALLDNAGPCPPSALLYSGGKDKEFATKCMLKCWDVVADWYSKAIHYLLDQEGVEVLLSHFHAIDLQEHTFIRFMKDNGKNTFPEEEYEEWLALVYEQTDNYLGTFLHYLDEGWSIIITSDHGQVAPEHEPIVGLGDMNCCIQGPIMEALGYTVFTTDENGQTIVDWSKTRAVAQQGNDIFINLKGRNGGRGIVDPEDQYELEEQIITDLYNYKDPKTGKRVVAVALRKKDAVVFGYGGETAGDIYYATAEGYNFDHTDGLTTNYGVRGTSLSPIFVAAGQGIKKGHFTDRMIRQIDVAPTMAALLGIRMPAQCEGAPVYQIFSEEF